MISKLWKLVQVEARSHFLLLLVMVLAGGFVELGGIATTAEMMGLVASKGEKLSGGPLSFLIGMSGADQPVEQLKFGLVITIGVLGLVHCYTMAKTYLRSQFVWVQDREISTRLFQNCLAQSYPWFLKQNSGELHRIIGSSHVTQSLINGFLAAAGHFAVAVTLSLALFWVNPLVTAIGLLLVLVAYGLVRLFTLKTLTERGRGAHASDAARRVAAHEAITSIRFVKTTAREDFFVERFSRHATDSSRGMVYHGIYVDTVRAFLEWMTFAGILSLSVYLVMGAEDFDSLLPQLTLYTMAGYRIVPAINELFGIYTRIKFDSHLVDQIEDLLDAKPEDPLVGEPVQGLENCANLVELKDLSFAYADTDRKALRGVNLEIPRGSWYGVVGTTGAGKTTLLDLISGLLRADEGQIVVGSSRLDNRVVKSWQSHLGVVPQEVILLDESVLQNVAFGVPPAEIDHELVWKVCEMAGLGDFLKSLPQALETRLGERGTRLSGGERQRVGLARALYRKPTLLLLDEATSALDQATEQRIIETLEELTNDCTLITVAHRLSSVQPCDQILVLEQGEIVGRGTFAELLNSSPQFQKLALFNATPA
ncbi:MAG: ABC transporter ATP-binding protein [Vulcanimicrobiota bacterium]